MVLLLLVGNRYAHDIHCGSCQHELDRAGKKQKKWHTLENPKRSLQDTTFQMLKHMGICICKLIAQGRGSGRRTRSIRLQFFHSLVVSYRTGRTQLRRETKNIILVVYLC